MPRTLPYLTATTVHVVTDQHSVDVAAEFSSCVYLLRNRGAARLDVSSCISNVYMAKHSPSSERRTRKACGRNYKVVSQNQKRRKEEERAR